MLENMRMMLLTHRVAAAHSIKMLWREPTASLMTIISIACILMLPAIFFILSSNIKLWTLHFNSTDVFFAYLTPKISQHSQDEVLRQVIQIAEVQSALLKTPEDGLRELSQQEGMQDIIHDLSENPLPAVIEVTPVMPATQTTTNKLYQTLQALRDVDQVKFNAEWMARVHAILNFLTKITQVLMVFFALAILFIIANTLRQMVENRQEEIQVLKLVGAKDAYIMRPFLYSGVLYGLISAITAAVLIQLFSGYLALELAQLMRAFADQYRMVGLSLATIGLLCFSAVILGWLGACLAVKRQLVTIESCK